LPSCDFEAALHSNASFTKEGLIRLCWQQILQDARSNQTDVVLHEQTDLTIATAVMTLRAKYHLGLRINSDPDLKPVFRQSIQSAIKTISAAIELHRFKNAINRPDFGQADRNRFLLAEVVKEGRSAKEPSESGLVELGI
jgi:hypothetical protein